MVLRTHPANDFCVVDVIVVPRGQQPQTAASHPKSGHDGDPVNTFTGEFLLAEEPDLHLLGPMPLHFSRYYASGLLASGIRHGSLEPTWLTISITACSKPAIGWTCSPTADE